MNVHDTSGMAIDLRDLALKFGAIVHDAHTLAGLLRQICGTEGGCSVEVMQEALNLADLVAGTAAAGMQCLPEPMP